MQGYFWNTVLAVNSLCWFVSLTFLSYAFGMLIVALEWKTFLIAVSIFVFLSITHHVFESLAHD